MPQIRIPPVLRPEAAGQSKIDVDATTARGALVAESPPPEERVLAGGDLPTFLNVFVDGEDIRLLEGLETKLAAGATVLLLPAVAGGESSPPAPRPGDA